MKKNLCIVAIMVCLMLWGCGQEEKQAEAPAPETMPAVEKAIDKAKEAAEAVAEKVEKTTEAVVEKAEQKIEAVEGKTAIVVEKAATVVEKSAEPTPAKFTTTVESVTIDNKNGKVVLSHKKHAEAYGCVVCHGAKKPGPQKLGKEAAHALCQGCHKEKKSGPTACNQCHQKKAKALEGC
ncbi:MAG: cytochrome c family protein [Proteobacteria bacterium]|nr:cytochrome c family protein [Pseudomonadota bacterium]